MQSFDEITPDEGFLSVILGAIPSGVFVTDLDHNILLINKAAATLAGRSQGDCFDRKCYEVFRTVFCKTEACLCQVAAKKDAVQQGITVMHRNGEEIPIEYANRPIKNIHGKIIGCVAHIMDISDRLEKERTITEQHEQVLKLLQEKSAQNIELDRANAELFQLSRDLEGLAQERTIAGMALEIADRIRNPAAAIGGLTRILQKDLPREIVESKKFKAIVQEVQKLESRVENFEHLASEQKKLFVREDLREIVGECLVALKKALQEKNIAPLINQPAKAVTVTANRRTLKIALLHVLRNAIDASNTAGLLEVGIGYEKGGPYVRVKNAGKSIPKDVRDRLFKETVSTKPKGSGRGLMLTNHILREHHGKITIRSSKGRGTTVTLLFPGHWEEKGFTPLSD